MLARMMQMILAVLKGVFTGLFRRIVRGRTQPSWSFGFEMAVAVQRAVVALMARLRGAALRRISGGGLAPSPAVAELPFERVSSPVRGAWIRPLGGGAEGGVVLFLHGGGYVVGSVDSHHDLAGRLVLAGGFDLFSLEYRLAPEHPHPTALEDALAAYRWLLELGHSAARLAIAGDSAGGGLTTALLVSIRDAGLPMPAAAALVCPWVDLSLSLPSIEANAGTDYLEAWVLKIWAADYAAGAALDGPTLSPLHADLAGLPPLLIQVGEAEILRDDGVELAAKAGKAGVDVTLEREPEMPHDWHMLARIDARGAKSIEDLAAFLRQHLDGGA